MYVVYKHTTPSGKVYVGITKKKPERRWQNGNGYKDNEHFYRAILKYGWENIKHEIVCTGLNKWQAGKVEQSLIKYFDSTDHDKGYNHSTGGECGALGHKVSAEARQEISEATKRALLNPELRQKMSESHKRAYLDNPELRRKLSEAHKGHHPSTETRQKMSESHRGVNHPFYGEHHSIETRRKISGALKGKHPSAETRQKLSESHKGKNVRAVICVETGILYSSVTEAGKSIGVTHGAISMAVRGVQKTAGGYHWRYAD